jgi:hypothetical protein
MNVPGNALLLKWKEKELCRNASTTTRSATLNFVHSHETAPDSLMKTPPRLAFYEGFSDLGKLKHSFVRSHFAYEGRKIEPGGSLGEEKHVCRI